MRVTEALGEPWRQDLTGAVAAFDYEYRRWRESVSQAGDLTGPLVTPPTETLDEAIRRLRCVFAAGTRSVFEAWPQLGQFALAGSMDAREGQALLGAGISVQGREASLSLSVLRRVSDSLRSDEDLAAAARALLELGACLPGRARMMMFERSGRSVTCTRDGVYTIRDR